MKSPRSRPSDAAVSTIAPIPFSIQPRPFNPQHIRPRRVKFHFSAEIPRLWVQNSSVKTQFVNGINLFIGEFESFMVRTLRSHLPALHDPAFRQQMSGFIGQELSHSHVHTCYNQTLRQQGYRFEGYLKFTQFFFQQVMNRLGPNLGLAITAGFEHVTASLAEIMLEFNALEDAHPTLKSVWEWHAAEELEHQALAFECLQIRDRRYGLRCLGALLGLAIVLGFSLSGMILLLVQDPGWRRWKTVSDAIDLFITGDRLLPRCLQRLLPYFKPNFQPDVWSTSRLSEQVLGTAKG